MTLTVPRDDMVILPKAEYEALLKDRENMKAQIKELKAQLEEKDTIILTLIILSSSLRRACGAGKELSKLYGEVMNELNYKEAGGEEAD